ncbi:tyrosinase [Microdochium nivale]|nr:tyrosinase [Microdochium nivale]
MCLPFHQPPLSIPYLNRKASSTMVAVRKNIRNLSVKELDDLITAWAGIQKLEPDNPNSFFKIAGYHGEPFRGAGYANAEWWGGYCNHGNVLFPVWHRAYLLRLESALQTIVPEVAMPYWDEIEEESLKRGIPDIFLRREHTFANGDKIPNPLYSYKFQARVTDRLPKNLDNSYNYTKHTGYDTVRCPFSGLVGTEDDRIATKAHNDALYDKGDIECNKMLNLNIVTWLNLPVFRNNQTKEVKAGIRDKFRACMNAPNYTVFSNTTSAQQWNDDRKDIEDSVIVVPLEAPHNSIHLAVGGFEIKSKENGEGGKSYNIWTNSNGDMGENDTASFDPCFYFHHAWIDLVFSLWQAKNGSKEMLTLIDEYPGTNSVDAQGPTPGVAGGTWLTLDSPLAPFKRAGSATEYITSRDVTNIKKLGYSYDYSGELLPAVFPLIPYDGFYNQPAPVLEISHINRSRIGGSFVISAWAKPKHGSGGSVLVGVEAVLSRQHVTGCGNCMNHLQVHTYMPLLSFTKQDAKDHDFEVIVHTRDGLAPESPGSGPPSYEAPAPGPPGPGRPRFDDGGPDAPGYNAPGRPQPKFKLHFGHLGI